MADHGGLPLLRDDALLSTLCELRDPSAAIAEMLRVTRPGGLVVVAEPNNLTESLLLDSISNLASIDDIVELVRFQLTCERAKSLSVKATTRSAIACPGSSLRTGARPTRGGSFWPAAAPKRPSPSISRADSPPVRTSSVAWTTPPFTGSSAESGRPKARRAHVDRARIEGAGLPIGPATGETSRTGGWCRMQADRRPGCARRSRRRRPRAGS